MQGENDRENKTGYDKECMPLTLRVSTLMLYTDEMPMSTRVHGEVENDSSKDKQPPLATVQYQPVRLMSGMTIHYH